MKITTIASNQTLVETPVFRAILSYGVPQVVIFFAKGLTFVNSKKYSNTTNKHRNAAVRDYAPPNFKTIAASPSEIQEVTGLECK